MTLGCPGCGSLITDVHVIDCPWLAKYPQMGKSYTLSEVFTLGYKAAGIQDMTYAPRDRDILLLHLCRGQPTIDQGRYILAGTDDAWILNSGGWRCYPYGWMEIPELPQIPAGTIDCLFHEPAKEKPQLTRHSNLSLEDLGL